MFVDRAQITVKAGNGGNGCCSFRREAFIPKGGPNGGDGAPGGNVILFTDPGTQSLADFVYNRRFAAENGGDGKGKDMHGRKGADLRIPVPAGTIVRNRETGDVLADMDAPDMEIVIAAGGRGGRGNARFATSTNRAPREHEEGEKTQDLELDLELKLVADAGFVGFPNAGKSTLLSAISNARPKIAPYPFTTLHPVIGILDYPDYRKISAADIPGLIDGAHLNVGLGHFFLRHIERTKLLIYVIDMAGYDGRDPKEDYRILKRELEAYMEGLSKRAMLIVANKMDLPGAAENCDEFEVEFAEDGIEVFRMSAATDSDFTEIRNKIRALVEQAEARDLSDFRRRNLL